MKKIYILSLFILKEIFSVTAQPAQSYCQQFNASRILMLTNTSQLNLSNAFTIEAWVYLTAASPYGIVLGKTFDPRSNDPYQNYVLNFDNTGLKPEFVQTTGNSGSYRSVTSPTNISLNTWTHIAGTLGGGQLKLYINGSLVGSQTSAGNPAVTTGVPFSLGSGATPSLQTTCCGVSGLMMQARVWSQEQTLSAIQTNMNIQLAGNESGLIACWNMNDSVGQSVLDITANAYHITRGTTSSIDIADPVPLHISDLGYFSFVTITLPSMPDATQELYVIDYNSDNLVDLMVSRLHWPPTLPGTYTHLQSVKNNGSMNFTDDTPIIGCDSVVNPRDYAVGDFNGDSKPDILIADHGTDTSPFPGHQNRIYYQNASGKLVESSAGNIPAVSDFSHNTTTADIDNDGDSDFYICNVYGQNLIGPRLLINNGTGQFTVNTANLPANIVNLSIKYLSSRFADIDKDGDPDLILGASDDVSLNKNAILLNNGSGVFTPATDLPNRYGGITWSTVAITIMDINNDSWPDILFGSTYQYQTCRIEMLINNKNGTFKDSSQNIPQSWPASNAWIKWIEPGDFNNDGWMDFAMNVDGGAPGLFLNTGNTKFVDASPLINLISNTTSVRARDFDNDGLTDVAFIDYGGHITIAKNLKPYVVTIDSTEILNGTSEISGLHIHAGIYPNPVNEYAHVILKNTFGPVDVKIYDFSSREIYNKTKVTENGSAINTKDFSPGLYFYTLSNNGQILGKGKMVVMH